MVLLIFVKILYNVKNKNKCKRLKKLKKIFSDPYSKIVNLYIHYFEII